MSSVTSEGSVMSDTSNRLTIVENVSTLQPVLKLQTLYLDVQKFAHPWEHPTLSDIIHSLQTKFPDDPSMVVEAFSGAQKGIYRITVSAPVEADPTLDITVGERKHKVPLKPHRSGRNPTPRKTGTLITFSSCTTGPLKTIPNSLFDQTMHEHGEVVKLCELQKSKGTSAYNGNRYLVLEPSGTIPNAIQITHPITKVLYDIRIRYKGQMYHCALCDEDHVGACPKKAAFYAAKEARNLMKIEKKIITGSTLRKADETGLKADIICMSGGRLGNLAHVMRDEPSMPINKEVVLIAGINDILNDSEGKAQFALLAECAVKNIAQSLSHQPHTTLTILPPLPPKDGWSSQLRKDKFDIYKDMLKELSKDDKNPFTYLTWQMPHPVEMEDIHPTQEGTKQMLIYLNSKIGDLIWEPNAITCAKPYQGVTPIYKYGCLTCCNYVDMEGDFCGICNLADFSREENEQGEHSYSNKRNYTSDSSEDEKGSVNKKPNCNDGQS